MNNFSKQFGNKEEEAKAALVANLNMLRYLSMISSSSTAHRPLSAQEQFLAIVNQMKMPPQGNSLISATNNPFRIPVQENNATSGNNPLKISFQGNATTSNTIIPPGMLFQGSAAAFNTNIAPGIPFQGNSATFNINIPPGLPFQGNATTSNTMIPPGMPFQGNAATFNTNIPPGIPFQGNAPTFNSNSAPGIPFQGNAPSFNSNIPPGIPFQGNPTTFNTNIPPGIPFQGNATTSNAIIPPGTPFQGSAATFNTNIPPGIPFQGNSATFNKNIPLGIPFRGNATTSNSIIPPAMPIQGSAATFNPNIPPGIATQGSAATSISNIPTETPFQGNITSTTKNPLGTPSSQFRNCAYNKIIAKIKPTFPSKSFQRDSPKEISSGGKPIRSSVESFEKERQRKYSSDPYTEKSYSSIRFEPPPEKLDTGKRSGASNSFESRFEGNVRKDNTSRKDSSKEIELSAGGEPIRSSVESFEKEKQRIYSSDPYTEKSYSFIRFEPPLEKIDNGERSDTSKNSFESRFQGNVRKDNTSRKDSSKEIELSAGGKPIRSCVESFEKERQRKYSSDPYTEKSYTSIKFEPPLEKFDTGKRSGTSISFESRVEENIQKDNTSRRDSSKKIELSAGGKPLRSSVESFENVGQRKYSIDPYTDRSDATISFEPLFEKLDTDETSDTGTSFEGNVRKDYTSRESRPCINITSPYDISTVSQKEYHDQQRRFFIEPKYERTEGYSDRTDTFKGENGWRSDSYRPEEPLGSPHEESRCDNEEKSAKRQYTRWLNPLGENSSTEPPSKRQIFCIQESYSFTRGEESWKTKSLRTGTTHDVIKSDGPPKLHSAIEPPSVEQRETKQHFNTVRFSPPPPNPESSLELEDERPSGIFRGSSEFYRGDSANSESFEMSELNEDIKPFNLAQPSSAETMQWPQQPGSYGASIDARWMPPESGGREGHNKGFPLFREIDPYGNESQNLLETVLDVRQNAESQNDARAIVFPDSDGGSSSSRDSEHQLGIEKEAPVAPELTPIKINTHPRIFVMPSTHPCKTLDDDQMQRLRQQIECSAKIANDEGGQVIEFKKIKCINGALEVICVDDHSLKWLKVFIRNLPRMDNMKMITSPCSMLSKGHRIDTYVQNHEKYILPVANILSELQSKNLGLHTKRWTLVKELETGPGRLFGFLMDDASFYRMKVMDFKPFFENGTLTFWPIKKKTGRTRPNKRKRMKRKMRKMIKEQKKIMEMNSIA